MTVKQLHDKAMDLADKADRLRRESRTAYYEAFEAESAALAEAERSPGWIGYSTMVLRHSAAFLGVKGGHPAKALKLAMENLSILDSGEMNFDVEFLRLRATQARIAAQDAITAKEKEDAE